METNHQNKKPDPEKPITEEKGKENAKNKSSTQSTTNNTHNANKEKENTNTKAKPEDNSMQDLIKHLLTGVGTMGGSYLLFIKPMQDKLDEMKKQIEKQADKIDDLQSKLKALTKKTEQELEEEDVYFKTKNNSQSANGTKKSARF